MQYALLLTLTSCFLPVKAMHETYSLAQWSSAVGNKSLCWNMLVEGSMHAVTHPNIMEDFVLSSL